MSKKLLRRFVIVGLFSFSPQAWFTSCYGTIPDLKGCSDSERRCVMDCVDFQQTGRDIPVISWNVSPILLHECEKKCCPNMP